MASISRSRHLLLPLDCIVPGHELGRCTPAVLAHIAKSVHPVPCVDWVSTCRMHVLQAEFQLSNVADGALPSAFLVGLLVASIIFSELTAHCNAFRMIGTVAHAPALSASRSCCSAYTAAILLCPRKCRTARSAGHAGGGFGVWMVGSLACAFVPSFWALVAFRITMGAGEASIITLTGPFIDDVAPPLEKTLWFGILNVVGPALPFHAGMRLLSEEESLLCAADQPCLRPSPAEAGHVTHAQLPTIGIAVGYIAGGLIGPALGWRAAFLIQVGQF